MQFKHIYNNDSLGKRTLMMVGMNFVSNGNGVHNDQIEICFFLTLVASVEKLVLKHFT
jgi:hypothetical protein